MSSDRRTVVVGAQIAAGEFDLVKLVRFARSLQIIYLDRPDEHYTFRDGEHPHYTAQSGHRYVSAAGPLGLRAPEGKSKHRRVGWPSRWADIQDQVLAGGMGFLYPEQIQTFRSSQVRSNTDRLVLTLRPGEGIQIGHYLVRASETGRAFVSAMVSRSHRAATWTSTRWDPWSFVIAEASTIAPS